MKKKILLITTGGTIASESSEEGLKPGLTSGDLMQSVSSITERYDVTMQDLFQLDSSNIQPEEWQLVAGRIAESYQDYDGIVVTHGTDTMAYTSSVMSYMLRNIPIPIVLTGSQLPVTHPLTDAKDNLFCAFAMAASGTPGVFLVFNKKVLRGCRAVKVRTTSFDAFESINCPPVAKVDVGGLIINDDLVIRPTGDFELLSELNSDVFLIKVIPGLNPRILEMLQNTDCKGIVIEAFGAGGMHFMRRDLISGLQSLADRGLIIVVCSQCLYESCDFSMYQTGLRLVKHQAIIQARDMTTEAAVTKLMWCLGQTDSMDRLRALFERNIAGEISGG